MFPLIFLFDVRCVDVFFGLSQHEAKPTYHQECCRGVVIDMFVVVVNVRHLLSPLISCRFHELVAYVDEVCEATIIFLLLFLDVRLIRKKFLSSQKSVQKLHQIHLLKSKLHLIMTTSHTYTLLTTSPHNCHFDSLRFPVGQGFLYNV